MKGKKSLTENGKWKGQQDRWKGKAEGKTNRRDKGILSGRSQRAAAGQCGKGMSEKK